MILKKIETLDEKHPCKGCVFSKGKGKCNVPKEIKTDQCLINGKDYIWIFDKVEGADFKTNLGTICT